MTIVLDAATAQSLLLLVELVLLAATFALLVANRREIRSREALVRQFTSVADVITRQEYFVAVVDTIQRAEKSLSGSVTGNQPSPEESEIVQQILESLSGASRRGVKVRYLLPLSPDRLRMGAKYTKSGAEVRFNPTILISDARYMCMDGKLVLVGVPERTGRNEPTRKGYSIPSESVSRLFEREFETQWNSSESKDYDGYLRELVSQAHASNPAASPELIANNLRIEKADVIAILRALGSEIPS